MADNRVRVRVLYIALLAFLEVHIHARLASSQALSISRTIREEEPPGSIIGRLIPEANLDRKYDRDEIAGLEFKFISQPAGAEGLVDLESSTGLIRNLQVVDREQVCPMMDECVLKYDVVVGPSEYFQIIKVTYIVEDINDHAPEFIDKEMTLDIPESTIPGTTFTIPAAKDLDGGRYSIKDYRLLSDSGIFELKYKQIAPHIPDLRVMLIDHLDREVRDRYELEVIAEDGGNPPRSGSLKIHVIILDSNDNEPQFEKVSYEVSVAENIALNTLIMTVRATDADIGLNGQIVYSFAPETRREYGHMFDIDRLTGEIRVKGSLDFEESSMYILSVNAHDQGHGTLASSTNVIVRLEDMNDRPPEVVINTISPSGMPEIAENMPIGTFVAHLSVTDGDTGDGGRFECSIQNKNFGVKKLSQNEYQIISEELFDREVRNRYEFPITCRDFGRPPQTSITNIIIHITDENDHSPVFTRAVYSIMVEENTPPGTQILQVNATDDDIGKNARIRYYIGGVVDDMFLIDGRAGVVTSTVLLDHEAVHELEFQVFAVDDGEPAKTATSTVVLTITDQNDEPPTCNEQNYVFYVEENLPPDTPVGRIIARDPDSSPHNEFHFSLQNYYHPRSPFTIDPVNGMITTRKILDREGHSSYDLVVVVNSATNRDHSSSCMATVHVSDRNDNKPEFIFPMTNVNDTLRISNRYTSATRIGTLTAVDKDVGPNAELMYAIISGNSDNTFSIDSSNGRIFLYRNDISNLDKVTFTLRVEVKDKGEPQLSSTSILYVTVDSSTRPHTAYTGHVSEASFLESEELTIILGITAGIIIVLICIALVVILCCCARKNANAVDEEEDKETQQRMLDGTHEDAAHKPSAVTTENGVMLIDIANSNYYSPGKTNGTHPHPRHDAMSSQPECAKNGYHQHATLPREYTSRPPDKQVTCAPPLSNGYPHTHYTNSLQRTVHNGSPRHGKGGPGKRSSSNSGEFVSFDGVDNDV